MNSEAGETFEILPTKWVAIMPWLISVLTDSSSGSKATEAASKVLTDLARDVDEINVKNEKRRNSTGGDQ